MIYKESTLYIRNMFSLDPLGLLSGSEEKEDPNDVGLLPLEHRGIYQNPYLIMALEDTASVAEVSQCLSLPLFSLVSCLSPFSFFLSFFIPILCFVSPLPSYLFLLTFLVLVNVCLDKNGI